MKVGFTPREAYSMYRSLSREVFNYFGYTHPKPRFSAADDSRLRGGEYAHCDFAPADYVRPEGWRGFLANPPVQPYPSWLRMHPGYLSYYHEDEILGILLHELAHASVGYEAGHGRVWSSAAAEIGGHDNDLLIIRNWQKLPDALRPPVSTVEEVGVYYA